MALVEDSIPKPVSLEGATNFKRLRIANVDASALPSTYKSLSAKEKVCNEYVVDFEEQFKSLYPSRKPLFLWPLNEAGVAKLVCTTIRPTLPQHEDLYDAKELAHFCADFFTYEPLERAYAPPGSLLSPTCVIQHMAGDCFDLAHVAASFLIGSGYDAYVVRGLAPEWIALRDETRQSSSLGDDMLPHYSTGIEKESIGERAPTVGLPESKYLRRMAFEAKKQQERASDSESDDETDTSSNSDIWEHAWLLVRAGSRNVEGDYFIEISSGALFDVDESPYIAVEAVWNNRNYWVCMEDKPVKELDWNLNGSSDWESIFAAEQEADSTSLVAEQPGSKKFSVDEYQGPHAKCSQLSSAEAIENGEFFQLPRSWVDRIEVPREKLEERFGVCRSRRRLFRKETAYLCAPSVENCGLQRHIVRYEDISKTICSSIVDTFADRSDMLNKRVRFPLEGISEQYFSCGRSYDGLKAIKEHIGVRREFSFYENVRKDGLISRIEYHGRKFKEYYKARPDHLIYRSVTFGPAVPVGTKQASLCLPLDAETELPVVRMSQKFSRNSSIDAQEDIAKRVFDQKQGQIVEYHHLETHRITARKTVYYKALRRILVTDSLNGPLRAVDETTQLAKMCQMEKDCFQAIKQSSVDAATIHLYREKEERQLNMRKRVWEESPAMQIRNESQLRSSEDGPLIDFLTPFLPYLAKDETLTREQAQKVYDDCLNATKARVIDQGNILDKRIEDAKAALSRRRVAYQRAKMNGDAVEDDFEEYSSQAMFRIQIMEQRRSEQERSALAKYEEMEKRLKADPRLRALH